MNKIEIYEMLENISQSDTNLDSVLSDLLLIRKELERDFTQEYIKSVCKKHDDNYIVKWMDVWKAWWDKTAICTAEVKNWKVFVWWIEYLDEDKNKEFKKNIWICGMCFENTVIFSIEWYNICKRCSWDHIDRIIEEQNKKK